MSLAISLNNALSGLKVNRESLAVLSQNIANANNPNYSRKIITQESRTLDGIGRGVEISDISRTIDEYLQRAIQGQTSTVGRADTLQDYAERLQILIGQPGKSSSIDSYITTFFTSLQALAETPERSSMRLTAVNAGNTLATEMNQLVQGINELRFDADREITAATKNVNNSLREIYNLNGAIANAHVFNKPVSELLDKRDAAVRNIAEFIDVNVFTRSDDTIRLYTAGGVPLVDDSMYEVSYVSTSSRDSLTIDAPLAPMEVYRLDASGNRSGDPTAVLSTSAVSSEVTTTLTTGKIKALMDVRDDKFPDLLAQLDMLAARMRDEVNAVHNAGTGFPGATTLTGTRAVAAGDYSNWTGAVRIGLVDASGQPLPSTYPDETSPQRPLTLDLSTMDSGTGNGAGYPSLQHIINEINQYYATPRNRLTLGNMNNIQLASNNQKLPAASFDFDFDLENISGERSDFFVTGVTVLDDTGADMTSVTSTIPSLSLASTGTYATSAGSTTVTVTAAAAHGLLEGDTVFMPDPGMDIDGIPQALMTGYFKISNVTTTSFDIVVAAPATGVSPTDVAGLSATPPYKRVETGEAVRAFSEGTLKADLTGNLSSLYYDIKLQAGVVDADGTVSQSTVTYRVYNNENNIYAKRYGATAATGEGSVIVSSNHTQPIARAILVDEKGVEIPKVNGQYRADQPGYLKIVTTSGSNYLVIDSMDSQEHGKPNTTPKPTAGTERGFSHYFEMNNFFESNATTATGDTVAGSAMNLAVVSRLKNDPSQVSTGTFTQSARPADPSKPPFYSYERIVGDNSIAQRLADVATKLVAFGGAGGLSISNQTLSNYAGEILGFAAADANSTASNQKSASVILQGFVERSSAISGVNLDEELANTIIYQNAFTASARIVTVTGELFDTLLGAFR